MTIHFICRGNVFRSRMAEAYLNSLRVPSLQAISSGALAEKYAQVNIVIEKDTIDFLKHRGLGKFSKPRWEQLTQEHLRAGNVTVCMSRLVYKESRGIAELPANTIVWDVKDVGEVEPVPMNKLALARSYENTFHEIKKQVDSLVKLYHLA